MHVLIFHGYLLRGTGSNIYNVNLAETMVKLGYSVDLFAQEHEANTLPFVDSVADWDSGSLNVQSLKEEVRCTVYRPPIGDVLPVYVADKYRHFNAKPFPQLSESELAFYVASNVSAIREVIKLKRPDFVLANHLVMSPFIMLHALEGTGIPFIVKVHGSDIEYTVKPYRERFLSYAKKGAVAAKKIIVGSKHVAVSLSETLSEPDIDKKVCLVPPGIDTGSFKKVPKDQRTDKLIELTALLETKLEETSKKDIKGDVFARDLKAAIKEINSLSDKNEKLVVYLGKLIVSKGIDLLLAAWPMVLNHEPNAKLVIIGFGAYEEALKEMVCLISVNDLDGVRLLAEQGRAREGGEQSRLSYLLAFLDALEGAEKAGYLVAAQEITESIIFTGRLEHDELPLLLGLAEVVVVPSTFPEAFGMVSVEAAASGAIPLVAKHSGLAEVAEQIADMVPEGIKELLTFELGKESVSELSDRLVSLLQLNRDQLSAELAKSVSNKFGWEGIVKEITSLIKK